MRILFIHNKYQQTGGEDSVLDSEIKLLSQYGHTTDVLFFDNAQLIKGGKLGLLQNALNSIYSRQSYETTVEKICSFKPDIIHVHNIFYVASPSVYHAARKYNTPIVQTLHNYRLICAGALLMRNENVCELCVKSIFPLYGIKYKCFQRSTVKTAQVTLITAIHKLLGTWQHKIDRYIVLTPFASQKITSSSLQIPIDKIAIKPNYVPDNGFLTAQQKSDYFIFVGRLSAEKGINILIALAQKTSHRLLIIGTGEHEATIKEIAGQYKNIEYLGFLPKINVIELMKKAKAIIFPSVWYEGLPTVILEAFSTGTPVIATDIENINTIVSDRKTGLLFPKNDVKALEDKMSELLTDFDLFRQLCENVRQEYVNKYSAKAVYQQQIKIYQSLIDDKT